MCLCIYVGRLELIGARNHALFALPLFITLFSILQRNKASPLTFVFWKLFIFLQYVFIIFCLSLRLRWIVLFPFYAWLSRTSFLHTFINYVFFLWIFVAKFSQLAHKITTKISLKAKSSSRFCFKTKIAAWRRCRLAFEAELELKHAVRGTLGTGSQLDSVESKSCFQITLKNSTL